MRQSNSYRFLWITHIMFMWPCTLHHITWKASTFLLLHLSLSLSTPNKNSCDCIAAMGVSFLSTCPSLLPLVAYDTPPSARYQPRSVSFHFALLVSLNTRTMQLQIMQVHGCCYVALWMNYGKWLWNFALIWQRNTPFFYRQMLVC